MIQQQTRTDQMNGSNGQAPTTTMKVFGLFRWHDREGRQGQWAAIVPGAPFDTRAGHDHLRNPERLPIGEAARLEIMDLAAQGNRALELVHRPDGKEYAFDRAVEVEVDAPDPDELALAETQRDMRESRR